MTKFSLEKALAGQPVKLRNGMKAYIIGDYRSTPLPSPTDYPLVGVTELIRKDFPRITITECWTAAGQVIIGEISQHDIIGMWEKSNQAIEE